MGKHPIHRQSEEQQTQKERCVPARCSSWRIMNRNSRHAQSRAGSPTSPINDRGANYFSTGAESEQRKKKNQKERTGEGGRLWKLPQPRKSSKVAFGAILLDDFLKLLGKASREDVLGFPTVPSHSACSDIHPTKKEKGTIFQRKSALMVAMEIRKKHGFPQPQQNRNRHNISFTPST